MGDEERMASQVEQALRDSQPNLVRQLERQGKLGEYALMKARATLEHARTLVERSGLSPAVAESEAFREIALS